MAPAHHSSQVEVISSDEERDVSEQRAEAMASTSLQASPAEKLRKASPAVKQGISKRLSSQASHDEPAVPKPEKAAPAAEAPPSPPPLPELDTCDDEESDQSRCSSRQKPKESPPPQDGVEAFGDDPWFAPKSEVRVASSEAAEAHHGSFKISVGDPSEEIARICQRPSAGAVSRSGGASGGFGEPDVAYAYRQSSRALHPDKNPDHPDAGEAFRRLKEAQDESKSNEMQMKRPQCASSAEACRSSAAVCALTGQGVVPPQAQQRAAACLRLPEGTWAAAHASTEALSAQWRSESGGSLEVSMHDALRTAYDCAPKRYRAQFLCLSARCAQVESDGSDGCVRRQWSKIWDHFPELQLWQKSRESISKKRQVHGRWKRDRQGAAKMSESQWSSWARRWRKSIVAVLPRGEDEAAAWSDSESRKLCAALWRDFADPSEKEEGDDATAARRCLGLFRAESRKASDMESQRGAAPAEWAFVPGDDSSSLSGEGSVGITVEGVFVSKDGTVPRSPFASAIFQTMM